MINKIHPHTETLNSEMICSICLDEIKNGNSYCSDKCKHIYHEKCIHEWFRYSGTCPECRITIKDNPISIVNSTNTRMTNVGIPPVLYNSITTQYSPRMYFHYDSENVLSTELVDQTQLLLRHISNNNTMTQQRRDSNINIEQTHISDRHIEETQVSNATRRNRCLNLCKAISSYIFKSFKR